MNDDERRGEADGEDNNTPESETDGLQAGEFKGANPHPREFRISPVRAANCTSVDSRLRRVAGCESRRAARYRRFEFRLGEWLVASASVRECHMRRS